jgi:hypothetical protein
VTLDFGVGDAGGRRSGGLVFSGIQRFFSQSGSLFLLDRNPVILIYARWMILVLLFFSPLRRHYWCGRSMVGTLSRQQTHRHRIGEDGRHSSSSLVISGRPAGRNRARSCPDQSASKRFFSQFIPYFVIALYHEWIRRIDEDGPSTHRRRLGSPSGRPRLIELASTSPDLATYKRFSSQCVSFFFPYCLVR